MCNKMNKINIENPVSDILNKMIAYSNGNLHDINHLLKVYAYSKLIGDLEDREQEQIAQCYIIMSRESVVAHPS